MTTRYRYRDTIFWAENGLIKTEDQRTGAYSVMTRKEALLKAKAFNEEISNMIYPDEREEFHRLVQNLISCVKEAKNQINLEDPQSIKKISKEIKRNRSSQLLLPSGFILGQEKIPEFSDFLSVNGGGASNNSKEIIINPFSSNGHSK